MRLVTTILCKNAHSFFEKMQFRWVFLSKCAALTDGDNIVLCVPASFSHTCLENFTKYVIVMQAKLVSNGVIMKNCFENIKLLSRNRRFRRVLFLL